MVRATDIKGKYTKKGIVISETCYPKSYMVNVNGQNYRRNRRHLLKVKEEPDSEHELETTVEPANQQETMVDRSISKELEWSQGNQVKSLFAKTSCNLD